MSTPAQANQQTTFFSLPTELRLTIYELFIPTIDIESQVRRGATSLQPALLAAHPRIKIEALVYYHDALKQSDHNLATEKQELVRQHQEHQGLQLGNIARRQQERDQRALEGRIQSLEQCLVRLGREMSRVHREMLGFGIWSGKSLKE